MMAAGGEWTPALLFNGGNGAWFEIKPEFLFQDGAGTIAVTSDGDPVGYVEDRSGNGNHAKQSASTSRPLYRTDGSIHWLEFDGSNDFLVVDNRMDNISGSTVFASAIKYDPIAATSAFMGSSLSSATLDLWVGVRGSQSWTQQFGSIKETSAYSTGKITRFDISSPPDNTLDISGSSTTLQSGSGSDMRAIGAFVISSSYVGFFNGNIYSMVVHEGSEKDSSLEKYLQELAGI